MATSFTGGRLGAAFAALVSFTMRLLWLNPFLWPWLLMFEFACVWATFWYTALFSVKTTGVFRAKTKSLKTNNSHPAFIFLATILVLLGQLVRKMFWFTLPGASSPSRFGQRPPSGDTDHWMTPPTSPPPFDGSESDTSEREGQAVPAPTLRQRLRTLGHKISVGASLSWKMAPSFTMYDRGPSWATRADRADVRMGIDRSLRAYNLFEEIKQVRRGAVCAEGFVLPVRVVRS